MKKLAQNKIKQKLKDYYRYLDSDFFEENNIIYMNCQDSVMIKATDMWENLELERKESYKELISKIDLNFDSNNKNVKLWKEVLRVNQ